MPIQGETELSTRNLTPAIGSTDLREAVCFVVCSVVCSSPIKFHHVEIIAVGCEIPHMDYLTYNFLKGPSKGARILMNGRGLWPTMFCCQALSPATYESEGHLIETIDCQSRVVAVIAANSDLFCFLTRTASV